MSADVPEPAGRPGSPVVVVAATGNPHKLEEFRRILGRALGADDPDRRRPPALDVRAAPADAPDPAETGDTFAANAAIKSTAFAAALGTPALADDSGLVVDCLGGDPGVRSARWSGVTGPGADRANLERVLEDVAAARAGDAEGGPDAPLTARFVCAVSLAVPDPDATGGAREVLHADGAVEGVLVAEARGDGGFGYDPIFVPVEWADGDAHLAGRTFGEVPAEAKDRISHRRRALEALARALAADPGVLNGT